ncbi:PREDICTED: uncharacterized protein LOC108530042 [Rhinopithecus bieti]|uniref:uncharacterized protein LOC108530042 n=1 Tax=Rhinopithecus bieti TaxID=61621 RepID=UPI00083C29EC|nr:PREDICTED: uncharacterized protein LOC108530042 [Rhinopithecus bieti]
MLIGPEDQESQRLTDVSVTSQVRDGCSDHSSCEGHPDLHVGREMPAAPGLSELERVCFTVECGGLASGISSASVSGLSPKGAGGPGQGAWEMYPLSWQTQESSGQGPLRLGGRVGCCRLGQAPSKAALVMEWGLWEDGPWGETLHCHLRRGLRLELLPPQSLSSLSHLGYIPLELHDCQCLHTEVWALLQTSLRSPFSPSFIMAYAAASHCSWQKALANSQKSLYPTLKLHFGQCG